MDDGTARLRELADIALRLLPQMRDPDSGLFSQKAELTNGGIVNRGLNPYYSAASLVGVLSQPLVAPERVVPIGACLDALAAAVEGGGDGSLLGTALWAGALAEDGRFARLVAVLDDDFRVAGAESATLGQALHGLAIGAEAFPHERDRAARVAGRCAAELRARFSPRAELFRAQPLRPTGVRSLLGAGITSFASQVYPLLGLASYLRWRGEAPPPLLRLVAERIVRAQGAQGQWWWLYSPRSGAVLERYPVYSVHQDGMAFMGLFPVERLGEGSYSAALARGVEWMFGDNELGSALAEAEPPFIPRNIQRRGSDADAPFGISRANFARVVARSLRGRGERSEGTLAASAVEPLRECRSYHLGWLLYAYSLLAN